MTTRNIAQPPEIKGHPILQKAWNQANHMNSNFICFVLGMPGTGKSTFAQLAMYLLDRGNDYSFRANLQNWCMTQSQFIEAVDRNGNDVGRVITWEEPYVGGVKQGGANARSFMKWANLQISTIFQTMRKNNHIIFLTLPDSISFDRQARSVAHCTVHIQKNNGCYGTARVYMREFNPIFKKEMFPFIKVKRAGRLHRVKNIFFGLPPKSWATSCNEKSDDYKDFWRREIKNYKESIPKGKSIRPNAHADFLKRVAEDKLSITTINNAGKLKWNYSKIAREFKIAYSTAIQWGREIEL